jgi:hypothetical protein
MSNDYFKAQGWFKNYAQNSQDSRGLFQQLVKEDEEAFRIASAETDKIKAMINKKFGSGSMKYGSEIPQPATRDDVIQIDAINSFMRRNPAAEGGRMGFSEGLSVAEKEALADMKKIENITEETLNKFRKIVDGLNIKENKILGKDVKHLPQDVTVQKLQKYDGIPAGYKRPRITNAIFKMILNEKGIKTYDNYRTEKIVKVLNNHLDKNKGDILSIKPSAASELLPEFKVTAPKGGQGNSIINTYRNFIAGGERIGQRSGITVPETIGGKPVSEIVTELDQNFLDIEGGRARGNFTVFEETKLLDQLANENPKVKALELKGLYEEAGGTNFKQRLLGLIPAKTGSGYTKESVRKGGINILEKVQEGVISNSLPESLKSAFTTYASGYNQGRFLAEADKFRKSNPELAYRFVNAANIVAGKARRIGLSGAGEHALPVSAIKTANAPVETLLQIDAYVDPQINNWKAKNFDEAIFSSNNGLAVQYKKATGEKKLAIQKEIMERFEFIKAKAPELMKNVTLDFTDGKFTASSTTAAIDTLDEAGLKKLGTRGEEIKNFFIKEMPDALTIDSKSGRITNIDDSFINRKIDYIDGKGGTTLSSGFNTDLLMKDPAVQKLLNSKAGQAVKNAARGTAGAVGKVFGVADILIGVLDYENNISKGQKEGEALGNAVQAMSFGLYKSGDRARIADVKERFVAKGGNGEIFDQATALNAKDQEINDLIYKSKFTADKAFMDLSQPQAILGKSLDQRKQDYGILKKELNEKIAKKMSERDNMIESYKTNLRVSEAGAPIQIGGNEFFSQPFKDIKRSTMEKIEDENKEAYDMQKRQLNFTSGNIGNFLQNEIFTMNPQERAQMQKYINEMDERELYKFNLERGMDPDNLIRFEDILNYKTTSPELMGVNTTKYINKRDQKSEGGITGLRSKYEYKK